jgi:hypothetical protein
MLVLALLPMKDSRLCHHSGPHDSGIDQKSDRWGFESCPHHSVRSWTSCTAFWAHFLNCGMGGISSLAFQGCCKVTEHQLRRKETQDYDSLWQIIIFYSQQRNFFFSIYNCSLQKSFAFLPWIDWYLLFICRAQKWKQIKDIILSSSSVQREKTDAHEVVPWKSLWWLNIEW